MIINGEVQCTVLLQWLLLQPFAYSQIGTIMSIIRGCGKCAGGESKECVRGVGRTKRCECECERRDEKIEVGKRD